jgi:hypothetical protein
MASTFHFFRDTLQINLSTIRALNAPGGATIVFGARSITLSELVSGRTSSQRRVRVSASAAFSPR